MKTFEITGFTDFKKDGDHIILTGPETMQVSDTYHTLDEVYDHRIRLFIQLCKTQKFLNDLANAMEKPRSRRIWRSKKHHPTDQPMYPGWFVLGIDDDLPGSQITYHLPLSMWDECDFAVEFIKAPKWDGHTPADVIERLKKL